MKNQETEKTKDEKTFAHKKSLGQNFLTSDVVPGWMCDAAEIKSGDVVLEIGPGTGRLTKTLLQRGAVVTAVEADIRAIESLKETFATEINSKQLTIHHGDSRIITPATLGFKDKAFKVVANIPYYLSGILLRGSLESEIQPTTLVFLMQKELVARIAKDKKASLLSLSVQVFGETKYIKTVSRGHFLPMPKVDSAILAVTNINRENFSDLKPTFFFELLHLGLGKKRKQLLANLTQNWKREDLEIVFQNINLPLNIRGEDLLLTTWLSLASKLANLPTNSKVN